MAGGGPRYARPEAAFTRLRDEAGAAGLFAYDHLEAVPESRDAPCFEAWTTLSALAAAFPGTRIGALVSGVSLRNTGLLAKMAVTVDAISGGNVVLGLGAGWYRSELNHHGIPVLPFAQRAAATGEACQALRALWAGHPVTAEVGTTMLREAVCAPRPVKGSIPIWIGGSSAAMQEVAASSADGISLGGTLEVAFEKTHGRLVAPPGVHLRRDEHQGRLVALPGPGVVHLHLAGVEQRLGVGVRDVR